MNTTGQDNDALAEFRSAVADAVPLKLPPRVDVKPANTATPGLLRRRTAAVHDDTDPNILTSEIPMIFGPHDALEFRRDGVQHGVYRKLKQGGYALESRLDLHRMTVEEARDAVFQFIQDCYAHDLRTLLILHGKGERSATPAKLKNGVAHWLKMLESVQAYASAQPQHGGLGAVYVLLRKSERSKQENAKKYR